MIYRLYTGEDGQSHMEENYKPPQDVEHDLRFPRTGPDLHGLKGEGDLRPFRPLPSRKPEKAEHCLGEDIVRPRFPADRSCRSC